MPKISIALTQKQYDEVLDRAKMKNLSITDYVISELPIDSGNKLTLSDVITRLQNQKSGKFKIPELFTTKEWGEYTKGSKLTVGKQFRKTVELNQIVGINFIEKTSGNLATYEKE